MISTCGFCGYRDAVAWSEWNGRAMACCRTCVPSVEREQSDSLLDTGRGRPPTRRLQILAVLAECGSMSAAQIGDELARRGCGTMSSNHHSRLAALCGMGLLSYVRRGRSRIYSLTETGRAEHERARLAREAV